MRLGNNIVESSPHTLPKQRHLGHFRLYISRMEGKAYKDGNLRKFGYAPASKTTSEHTSDRIGFALAGRGDTIFRCFFGRDRRWGKKG
jgi:hypothetical protein